MNSLDSNVSGSASTGGGGGGAAARGGGGGGGVSGGALAVGGGVGAHAAATSVARPRTMGTTRQRMVRPRRKFPVGGGPSMPGLYWLRDSTTADRGKDIFPAREDR
jgi:hypothetical protein